MSLCILTIQWSVHSAHSQLCQTSPCSPNLAKALPNCLIWVASPLVPKQRPILHHHERRKLEQKMIQETQQACWTLPTASAFLKRPLLEADCLHPEQPPMWLQPLLVAL